MCSGFARLSSSDFKKFSSNFSVEFSEHFRKNYFSFTLQMTDFNNEAKVKSNALKTFQYTAKMHANIDILITVYILKNGVF